VILASWGCADPTCTLAERADRRRQGIRRSTSCIDESRSSGSAWQWLTIALVKSGWEALCCCPDRSMELIRTRACYRVMALLVEQGIAAGQVKR
jgi:hypothetical protein